MTTQLVIMAKAPLAGQVKTRLVPALGAQGAAQLAQRMLTRTVTAALAARGEHIHGVTICASPDSQDPAWSSLGLPSDLNWSAQGDGDLGQRMARAVQSVLSKKEHVLLIGTDLPQLSSELMQSAAKALLTHEACLLPTADGGYGLLGLRAWQAVFDDMPWSTPEVCDMTLERLTHTSVWVGPTLHDIDEPADLVHWPDQALITALQTRAWHVA